MGDSALCPDLATGQASVSAGHRGRPRRGGHLLAACGKHRFFCFSWNSLYPRETESGQSCSPWKCHMCFPTATWARMSALGAAAPSPHPTRGIAFTPPGLKSFSQKQEKKALRKAQHGSAFSLTIWRYLRITCLLPIRP